MFRRLTNRELKRARHFINVYSGKSLGVSPDTYYYGAPGELISQKLVMASAYMLFVELGIVDEEDMYLSYLNTDMDTLTEQVAVGMMEDCTYDNSFQSAFENIGWNDIDAKEIGPLLLDVESVEDYYGNGCDIRYVCYQNSSWARFFSAVREHNLLGDSLYKKVVKYLPKDFLNYYFSGDTDGIQPLHGYFCHMMGYDGGDCDLNMLALDITFPLKCLICESYMYKLMDKYPFLEKEVFIV